MVLVDGPEQAIAAANAIAPEHLELMCADAEELVPLVRNAGAVFVGADASAVIGDYVAGVNHVLPTGGTARFADALRVDDFRKHMHVVSLEPGALRAARAVRHDAGRGRRPRRARRRDPAPGAVVSSATERPACSRATTCARSTGYHSPQVDVPCGSTPTRARTRRRRRSSTR